MHNKNLESIPGPKYEYEYKYVDIYEKKNFLSRKATSIGH